MTEDEMYDIIRGYEDSERDYHERNIELEAENAKLRELCEGMLVCYEPCNRSLDARTDCPLYDDGEPLRCRKARLLRELGIEVDE